MEKQDVKEFLKVITALATEYGGSLPNDDEGFSLKMKFLALKKYSIEQIKEAAIWIFQNREKTFPAIPTSKEFIDVIEKRGKTLSVASEELMKVLSCLRDNGATVVGNFTHPITSYLMKKRWPYSSWAETVTEKDLQFFERDFIKEFQAFEAKGSTYVEENILIDKNSQKELPKFKFKEIE